MASSPCKECGRRPKVAGRHRCVVCQLRHAPIDEQVSAAHRRLAMVPEELRVKRSKTIEAAAPAGTSWCAGCQSFRDLEDFGKATQCRACVSARSHAAMVEKVYGIDSEQYAALLKVQGGKCAICRARPRSKRLAVDHDHKTGAVRGLLCSRCNKEALGSLHDSVELAWNAWVYLSTPPGMGQLTWDEHLDQSRLRRDALSAPEKPREVAGDMFARPSATGAGALHPAAEPGIPVAMAERWQMVGSGKDPERGRYLVYIDRHAPGDQPPF